MPSPHPIPTTPMPPPHLPLLSLLLFLTTTAVASAPPPPPEQPKTACLPPDHDSYPFCNTSLPITARARSLVSLLSLPEKALLLSSSAAAVPRLGLPAYEWWSESLHGVASNGPGIRFGSGLPIPAATTFPQVILMAASFNRTLWSAVARAIAVEARAMHNAGQAGVTFWAPNINVFRDPRWGRGQETPGEDPMVASEYAEVYSLAFQGEYDSDAPLAAAGDDQGKRVLRQQQRSRSGEGRLMLSACCKHYTAYDLEKWENFTRYTFDAVVTEQDMEDTYQPPFRRCVSEGRASCLMCSYNAVNGVPLCASGELLSKVRDDWGFQGYITSDCNAVATIFEYQGYVSTPEDAVADALKAGVDLNCGGYYSLYTQPAIDAGKVAEVDVDRALLNLFSVQLRLGLFDGADPLSTSTPFAKLGPSDVCTAEHCRLALEAARQGIVLLKNDKGLLPWSSKAISSLAVIGPAANNSSKLGGDYTGVPCEERSLLDGLRGRVHDVSFAAGCIDDIQCRSSSGFEEAIRVAGQADAVVVVAGLDLTQETEELDRTTLLLPGKQAELVSAVAAASKRPVLLVLVGGGPMDVGFAEEDPRVGSILWVGYPGEAGAVAVADVIFGDYNPGGRLPVTWYPESFTKVPMNDMNMRPNPSRGYPGRTYRFYTGPVVYKFGHGLSYSNHSHQFIWAPNKISLSAAAAAAEASRLSSCDEETGAQLKSTELQSSVGVDYVGINVIAAACEALKFQVHVSVTNEGGMDGSQVVLLFSKSRTRLVGAPQKQLIGFNRVETVAGQVTKVTIEVEPCTHLSTANEQGELVLPLGTHVLMLEDGAEHLLSIEI